jgi:hypothetical protein
MFIHSPYRVGVVDTNQASLLPPFRPFTGIGQPRKRITLTPHVLGEILLRGDPYPTLNRLLEYDIQFGLEISAVHQELCKLSESDVSKFTPFLAGRGNEHRKRIYSALDGVRTEHTSWAVKMKALQRDFCKLAVEQVREGRKTRGPKIDQLEEILNSPDFVNMVVETVTQDGNRPSPIPKERLFRAVMENPYLGRLWRCTAYMFVSWQRRWRDQTHNFDPSEKRDDFPDMTLPLWASQGDVLLTKDVKLRRMISLVEPERFVTCSSASDF